MAFWEMIIAAAVLAVRGIEGSCEASIDGLYEGMITSSGIEALGIDNVERCYPGPRANPYIQDIEARCEPRYCCYEPCTCREDHVVAQHSHCHSDADLNRNMTCLVQHLHSTFRWYKWKCCDGYVEHPDTHQCLITCEKDNGGCHQICHNSVDTPHNAKCYCQQGYKTNPNDTTSCLDIDECADTIKAGCSHQCNNTIGGYSCHCPDGYQFITGSIYTCKEITTTTQTTTTTTSNTTFLPIAGAVEQVDSNNGSTFIIIAITGALILLAIVILLIIFVCRRKKDTAREVFISDAYANDTYGDLEGKAHAIGGTEPEYTDIDEKKKVPIKGAVGVDNPSYNIEKRPLSSKEIEATRYTNIENTYDEIPYEKSLKGTQMALNNPGYIEDINDGYEQPVGKCLMPPEYAEIPTLEEVNPSLPSYTSPAKQAVRFKDFQNVGYDNANNEILDHYVDINDVKIKKGKKI